MTDIGVFRLTNETPELEARVRQTVAAINYPWELLKPYFKEHGIDAVQIKTPMSAGVSNTITGLWEPSENVIYLGTQFTDWLHDVPFVLTHEVGHMVDAMALTGPQKTELMRIMHDHPDFSAGPYGHDSAEMHHDEYWWNGGADTNYSAKIYECFADEFVASCAPGVWDGTAVDGPQHSPRFVHWSTDLDAIRKIIQQVPAVQQPPAPPAPPKEPPVRYSRDVEIDRALSELNRWVHRHPRHGAKRTAVLLSRKILRHIKPHKA